MNLGPENFWLHSGSERNGGLLRLGGPGVPPSKELNPARWTTGSGRNPRLIPPKHLIRASYEPNFFLEAEKHHTGTIDMH
jgi:hypothetical protein